MKRPASDVGPTIDGGGLVWLEGFGHVTIAEEAAVILKSARELLVVRECF